MEAQIIARVPWLECRRAAELALRLREALTGGGFRVVGVQLSLVGEGCVARLVVVAAPGEILVFELQRGRPEHPAAAPSFEDLAPSREKTLAAAALYMLSPEPEETVLEEMSRLVSREEAEKIAALVWKISFGEGYTLDGWAGLLEKLTVLSPWECILRFQELVEKGLRTRPRAEPLDLDPMEVLRHCCKVLGTG